MNDRQEMTGKNRQGTMAHRADFPIASSLQFT